MTLNTGEFFGEALNPYLKQVVDATKPLQPIIDTIFTPVPVISDLSKAAGGSEITIATLAEKFNTLPEGAKIQPFLKAIKLVKQLLAVKCDGTPAASRSAASSCSRTGRRRPPSPRAARPR